jgi:hypothetical protein
MAWITYRMDPALSTASDWFTLADLVLVRGIWAPLALYGVLRAQNTPARSDVIPPNLLSWTIALGVVAVSFTFSESLVAEHGQKQTLVAVATAGVLLGFFVLATQSNPFSQMVGALRIENAIALCELGGERRHSLPAIQLGQIAVVVLTVALYRGYLQMLTVHRDAMAQDAPEGPTL